MKSEYTPNIYQKMANERLLVASAQIDVLREYDPKNNIERMQALYEVAHEAMISSQSEHCLEKMETIIKTFDKEIRDCRCALPDLEDVEKVRKKLSEVEGLVSSGSF
jgi:hypothetical protein